MIFSHLCAKKINLEKWISITFNKRIKRNVFSMYKNVPCPVFSSRLLSFGLFLTTYVCNNLLNSRELIPLQCKPQLNFLLEARSTNKQTVTL